MGFPPSVSWPKKVSLQAKNEATKLTWPVLAYQVSK